MTVRADKIVDDFRQMISARNINKPWETSDIATVSFMQLLAELIDEINDLRNTVAELRGI